jgi:protein-ribulosamine 3-kinase
LTEAIQQACIGLLAVRASRIAGHVSVGGGCINSCARIDTDGGIWFVKWNDAAAYPGMLESEAKGLQLLRETGTLRVPEVVGHTLANGHTILLLEWLEPGRRKADFFHSFGIALAQLHRHTSKSFGLAHDNYIGSLPQRNRQHPDWAAFFAEERLEPQLRLAVDAGALGRETIRGFQRLYLRLPDIFPDEPPALLHGDLWSGNYLVGPEGEAAIVDPAVYYGHREMDLAMARLFGGFDSAFYEGYQSEWPTEPGLVQRAEICNLYPLLVHVNLFGGGYAGQVREVLKQF